MALQDIINTDLQIIAADLGDPVITWKGEDYECIPSGRGNQSTLELGGLADEADLVVNVRKELFSDDIFPTSQQRLTYLEKEYRIQSVRQDATNAFIRLTCIDTNRGV